MGIMGTLAKHIGQRDNIDNMHKITINWCITADVSTRCYPLFPHTSDLPVAEFVGFARMANFQYHHCHYEYIDTVFFVFLFFVKNNL